MVLSVSFSPCPNDTYLFYAWVHGHVAHDLPLLATLADIETLNASAKKMGHDVTKLSLAAYPHLWDQYQMLPVGTALGKGYGPKIVGLPENSTQQQLGADFTQRIQGRCIAVPGENTTAYLAMKMLYGSDFTPLFCPYHEVLQAVKDRRADYGLLIHETRTHFTHEGVKEYVDLGEVWRKRFGLDLPLGGIFMKRDLSHEKRRAVVQALRDSLAFARKFPLQLEPYMMRHAQEKELAVIHKHITLYVTEETEELSQQARKSVWHFLFLGYERRWWSHPPEEWLWDDA